MTPHDLLTSLAHAQGNTAGLSGSELQTFLRRLPPELVPDLPPPLMELLARELVRTLRRGREAGKLPFPHWDYYCHQVALRARWGLN